MQQLQARSPATRRLIAETLAVRAALTAEKARSHALIRDLRGLGRRLSFFARRYRVLIAGGSDDDTELQQEDRVRLTATVLTKLGAGTLPPGPVSRVWVGDRIGATCDACDRPTSPRAVEYEMNMYGPGLFRFDRQCFVAWQRERTWYQARQRSR